MQEMVELSKGQSTNTATELQVCQFCSLTPLLKTIITYFKAVFFRRETGNYEILMAGPSHFGSELRGDDMVSQELIFAIPLTLCDRKHLL